MRARADRCTRVRAGALRPVSAVRARGCTALRPVRARGGCVRSRSVVLVPGLGARARRGRPYDGAGRVPGRAGCRSARRAAGSVAGRSALWAACATHTRSGRGLPLRPSGPVCPCPGSQWPPVCACLSGQAPSSRPAQARARARETRQTRETSSTTRERTSSSTRRAPACADAEDRCRARLPRTSAGTVPAGGPPPMRTAAVPPAS